MQTQKEKGVERVDLRKKERRGEGAEEERRTEDRQ